jgi:hypothetical protein
LETYGNKREGEEIGRMNLHRGRIFQEARVTSSNITFDLASVSAGQHHTV